MASAGRSSQTIGIWFSDEKREWYDDDVGDPNRVTDLRFHELVKSFDDRLQNYDEVYFYHNPGRFHLLYERLLEETKLKDRVQRRSGCGYFFWGALGAPSPPLGVFGIAFRLRSLDIMRFLRLLRLVGLWENPRRRTRNALVSPRG